MARRFVDISVPLEAGIKSDPEFMLPEIDYETHLQTAPQISSFFPGPGCPIFAIERLKSARKILP